MSVPLGEREAHVWYVLADSLPGPRFLRQCEDVLSNEERERADRFTHGNGRQLYILSHGFLRLILSKYERVSPESWRFTRNALGKPELDPSLHCRSLCFNLTHTAGLAAVCVARNREVGVDAEDVTRRGRKIGDELIRRCLSPHEMSSFLTVPEEQRDHAFFDYWTLKEAYLKARGFGLLLPVEGITFSWLGEKPHEGPVGVSFSDEIQDDPRGWQFDRFNPTTTHKVSVAVRRFGASDLTISTREYSPRLIHQEVL